MTCPTNRSALSRISWLFACLVVSGSYFPARSWAQPSPSASGDTSGSPGTDEYSLLTFIILIAVLFVVFRIFDTPPRLNRQPAPPRKPKGPKASIGELMVQQGGKLSKVDDNIKVGSKKIWKNGDKTYYLTITEVDQETPRIQQQLLDEEAHKRAMRRLWFNFILLIVGLVLVVFMASAWLGGWLDTRQWTWWPF